MWCLGLEGSPQRQEKQREGEREGGEDVTKLLNLGIRITWEAFKKIYMPRSHSRKFGFSDQGESECCSAVSDSL